MAMQSPFFNKRDNESFGLRGQPIAPMATSGQTPMATAPAQASPAAAATALDKAVPAEGSKLTVGPNIKLKGVEITDCDTLVVEGTVEATMDSRVIRIAETGTFKGSAEIDLAEIRGLFDGELTVRDKLVIHATGKVTGTVHYGRVVIEDGGQLSGKVVAGPAPSADKLRHTSAGSAGKPALQARA